MSPLLVGVALGATSAFMLDPQLGRRRRALVRDKVVHGVHESREFADAASKDLRYRAKGIAARARSLRGGATPDEILVERAWKERLRVTVTVERDRLQHPASILVLQPPVTFDKRSGA